MINIFQTTECISHSLNRIKNLLDKQFIVLSTQVKPNRKPEILFILRMKVTIASRPINVIRLLYAVCISAILPTLPNYLAEIAAPVFN